MSSKRSHQTLSALQRLHLRELRASQYLENVRDSEKLDSFLWSLCNEHTPQLPSFVICGLDVLAIYTTSNVKIGKRIE
jgi:hypothetical protein